MYRLRINGIKAGVVIKKLRIISFYPEGHNGVFLEVSSDMLIAPVVTIAGKVTKIVV